MRNRRAIFLTVLAGGGVSDAVAPTFTISALSAVSNVVSMQIVASEEVTGFEVGDITISAGGSLASFATADNITFTVSWTLAAGANTMDIAAGVCEDLAGNSNTAAAQYALTVSSFSPTEDTHVAIEAPDTNFSTAVNILVRPQAGVNYRGLMMFDLSSLAGKTVLSASQKLVVVGGAGATGHTVSLHRILAANNGWVGASCTWNYKTPSSVRWAGDTDTNGGTDAGCTVSGTDYAATALATIAYDIDVVGTVYNAALDLAEFASMVAANHGIWATSSRINGIGISAGSQNNITAGNRPVLTVVYVP